MPSIQRWGKKLAQNLAVTTIFVSTGWDLLRLGLTAAGV